MQAALGSWRLAGLAFLSLPAALSGGLVAGTIFGGVISLGSIVALFALLGITARNAVMLMKRFQQLDQQQPFGSELVLRGARERLAPILMTASATVLLILPALFMGDVPGLEILRPMTIVMLGGLITSTVTTVFMVPALYLALGVSGVRELELEGPMVMATPAMSAG
jgi:Cu/Ag efflux pump CusA